jgi:hypothetical protein
MMNERTVRAFGSQQIQLFARWICYRLNISKAPFLKFTPNSNRMSKRSTFEYELDTILHDTADAIVNDVECCVFLTQKWILVQQTIDQMWSKYEQNEISRRMLYYKYVGGSKKGRKIIRRDFSKAYDTLMQQYFVENPLYNAGLFRRRFRVSKATFERVYNSCLKHPHFRYTANAAGRFGIHPLVKITACFRHIAYGTVADQLDEHFQISQSTFLKTRHAFCDVCSILNNPLFLSCVLR